MKIISIVGKKNTGKTTLTTKIIQELTKRGYNTASIKHSHHTIEMDKENTDTWKHKQAGANLVVGVGSTTFYNTTQEHNLNRILYLLKHFDNYDYIIIEGYKNYNYPKITTSPELKDKYTIKEINALNTTPEDIKELADLIEKHAHDITNTLYTHTCGYNNGETIAQEIRNGTLTQNDLDHIHTYLSIDEKVIGLNQFVSNYIKQNLLGIINTLNLKDYGITEIGKIELIIPNEKTPQKQENNNCTIEINNKNLITNKFTKNLIANTITGMINSLKTPDKTKQIELEITNINNNNLKNAKITLKTNKTNLEINEFTSKILKETTYSIINTLKTDDEIKQIKITVEDDIIC
ncbi:MAG: molybdopterin-guanine dinucleotide biosynthesis protein B [Methanobrevibacter thaueri]|nr:molybdopterin-guanine dinucleotide biosynthesis protein B [Methanobrevibacter thaueri]